MAIQVECYVVREFESVVVLRVDKGVEVRRIEGSILEVKTDTGPVFINMKDYAAVNIIDVK